MAKDLNEDTEVTERRKKHELKQRREAAGQEQTLSSWRCSKQGCDFIGQSMVGLVNVIKQKHSSVAQHQQSCPHCGNLFYKQGLIMHMRFCKNKSPTRRMTKLEVLFST